MNLYADRVYEFYIPILPILLLRILGSVCVLILFVIVIYAGSCILQQYIKTRRHTDVH